MGEKILRDKQRRISGRSSRDKGSSGLWIDCPLLLNSTHRLYSVYLRWNSSEFWREKVGPYSGGVGLPPRTSVARGLIRPPLAVRTFTDNVFTRDSIQRVVHERGSMKLNITFVNYELLKRLMKDLSDGNRVVLC